MKCLIVEDDPALAGQLAGAMRDGGFACDIAHDGTEGEFLGATESYDLAVLDLGLPGLPGIEVLTRWRQGGVTMPVLILTARGDWTDKVAGFRAGADDYAVKPFRLEEVVIRAQTLVRRDLQRQVRRLVRETGVAALFVTHDLTEAVSLADRIVVLAGAPARLAADLAGLPPNSLAVVWEQAAALAHRPELASVVAGLDAG